MVGGFEEAEDGVEADAEAKLFADEAGELVGPDCVDEEGAGDNALEVDARIFDVGDEVLTECVGVVTAPGGVEAEGFGGEVVGECFFAWERRLEGIGRLAVRIGHFCRGVRRVR